MITAVCGGETGTGGSTLWLQRNCYEGWVLTLLQIVIKPFKFRKVQKRMHS